MKTLLTFIALLSIMFPAAAAPPKTNAVTVASTLPTDVVQADAKVLNLNASYRALNAQCAPLNQKQHDRINLSLPPDAGLTGQINQLRYQMQVNRQQYLPAAQWDLQIRQSHGLPKLIER